MLKDAPRDKSLFYYGLPFHLLLDPWIKPQREIVLEMIPARSSVLDVGCGTGMLTLALRKSKECRVVAIDLSWRMLRFAKSRNPYDDVTFLHRDATSLHDFKEGEFDYGILCQVLHELQREQQIAALKAVKRLTKSVILVDWGAPLPRHPKAWGAKVVEATLGAEHNPQFKAFLALGGLLGIVADAGLTHQVARAFLFNQGCNQAVVLN